jgi:hypothetical protein
LKGKQTIEFKKGGANMHRCERRGKPIVILATKGNHAIPPIYISFLILLFMFAIHMRTFQFLTGNHTFCCSHCQTHISRLYFTELRVPWLCILISFQIFVIVKCSYIKGGGGGCVPHFPDIFNIQWFLQNMLTFLKLLGCKVSVCCGLLW